MRSNAFAKRQDDASTMDASTKVVDARLNLGGVRSAAARDLVKVIREHRLSYEEFVEACHVARQTCELKRAKATKVVKPVPSLDETRTFLAEVEKADTTDALMIKIMLYMGIRTVELVNIRIEDIDITPGAERIYLRRKGGRDKTMVIPAAIAGLIRMYMGGVEKQIYLFEPSYHKKYDERSIRAKIERYRAKAGCSDRIHAHNFRHMILTLLAAEGWSDSELQLVSGHDSRTSLDKYIYQNPETIRTKLNASLSKVLGGIQ